MKQLCSFCYTEIVVAKKGPVQSGESTISLQSMPPQVCSVASPRRNDATQMNIPCSQAKVSHHARIHVELQFRVVPRKELAFNGLASLAIERQDGLCFPSGEVQVHTY